MPPISPELRMLLDRVLADIDRMRTVVDQIQKQGEEYVSEEAFREQIRQMKADIDDLKGRLERMERAIIDNQNTNYKRVIGVQAFILSPFALAVIGYIIKVIFHM